MQKNGWLTVTEGLCVRRLQHTFSALWHDPTCPEPHPFQPTCNIWCRPILSIGHTLRGREKNNTISRSWPWEEHKNARRATYQLAYCLDVLYLKHFCISIPNTHIRSAWTWHKFLQRSSRPKQPLIRKRVSETKVEQQVKWYCESDRVVEVNLATKCEVPMQCEKFRSTA